MMAAAVSPIDARDIDARGICTAKRHGVPRQGGDDGGFAAAASCRQRSCQFQQRPTFACVV